MTSRVEGRRKRGSYNTRLPASMKGAKVQKSMLQTFAMKHDGVLDPPWKPSFLISLLSKSPSLRPAIDAYAVNIDQFGHVLRPTLDMSRDDIREIVSSSMLEERRAESEALAVAAGVAPLEPATPTRSEIDARIAEVKKDMERERQALEFWLKACCPDMTWIELRKVTRVDLELTGNAYWEVVRNGLGEPVQLNHIPVASIAAMVRDSAAIDVEVKLHKTPITIAAVKQRRRFRRYLQQGSNPGDVVFYKEHGDPRVMSSKTGTYYKDARALKRAEGPEAEPATEVRHFRIPSPASEVYGAPRWEGCMLGLCGAREAEEINYLYFNNKSVPPMAVLVSGATVSKDTVDEIKDTIENDLHGTKNFHRVLVIQAETSQGALSTGTAKIELKPLIQVTEGQFMSYIEANASQLVGSFRLPQLYRGEVSSFNRATAQVAVEVTEQQVFHPEREAFDSIINRFFLYDLGIRYWQFKSLGPPTANADERATIVADGSNKGIPTLNEARELWGVLAGRELERINEDWADLPLPVALEAARMGLAPSSSPAAPKESSPTNANSQEDAKPAPSKPKAPRARPSRKPGASNPSGESVA